MPRLRDPGDSANDNIDPEELYQRAKTVLEAHFKLSGSEGRLSQDPKPTIEALVTNLMHYCATENIGAKKSNPHYLDFDEIFKTTKKNFEVQDKALTSVADKAADTYVTRFWDHALGKGPRC